MISVSWISMSPEMLSRLVDAQAPARPGGRPRERRLALVVALVAGAAGLLTALLTTL